MTLLEAQAKAQSAANRYGQSYLVYRSLLKQGSPEVEYGVALTLPTFGERIGERVYPSDNWVPANNGTETEFRSRSGLRLLYCWQPSTGLHAYINLDTDIALTDEEANAALMLS